MRYALRNKHKIEAAYDAGFMKRMKSSLDRYFASNDVIEQTASAGDRHPTIKVDGFVFYVTRQTYDVYNLAFKEVIR